jgi:hypothetical protein
MACVHLYVEWIVLGLAGLLDDGTSRGSLDGTVERPWRKLERRRPFEENLDGRLRLP